MVALALVLVGCTAGGGSGGANSPGKASNTITWAEQPGVTPNWIWPFVPLEDYSNVNGQMSSMMYRPLYWFGNKGKTGIDESLSLAEPPKFSNGDKTITISLKPYKWSNGEAVTAQNVAFWINMERAEKLNYAGYNPGQFPDNVVSTTTPDSSTVVLNLDRAYSQQWYTANQLSQITPMPEAWDMINASEKGTCSTDVKACAAVYKYLSSQSKNMAGYAHSALWSVVDGPWKLKSFNSDGHVSFVPNASYSGPTKARIKQFNMAPFTSDSAEFNVLRSGSTLDIGYIPTQDISAPHPANLSQAEGGPNPLSSKFNMHPWFLYGINFMPINFTNPTVSPMLKQLYVRQALQSVVDQEGIVTSVSKGYGVSTTGPVPLFPDSAMVSPLEKKNPYPFSISKAKTYLSNNGWTVVSGGATTCSHPGAGVNECGAGIASGQKLAFTLLYTSGDSTLQTSMDSLKSNAAKIGMQITLKTAPFNTVSGTAVPTDHTWQMLVWGGGWTYGYYPTGELLFATGSGSNAGGYSDSHADNLITATNVASGTAVLHSYEDYMAEQLPVIYLPNLPAALTEVSKGVKGFGAQNPYAYITPEEWHF